MRRTRFQGWWDEFRYGEGWQWVFALVLTGALIVLVGFFLWNGHFLSAAEIAEQQRRKEAACIARGGHIVEMIAPGRGVGNWACYGGKWPWSH